MPTEASLQLSNHVADASAALGGPTKAEEVLKELDRILASQYFRSAGRSRQFLQYVVQHKLAGHADQLKERTIGTELFQRSPGYATGDDPVVRVQAGEVRRRLDQYYQTTPDDSLVSIRLPVGSYSPSFHWLSDEIAPAKASVESPSTPPAACSPSTAPVPAQQTIKPPILIWLAAAVCLVVALVIVHTILPRPAYKSSAIDEFWRPVFATRQPVMVCLAKPVMYRPSPQLYERYARTHPGTFQTEVERYNHVLPLDPRAKTVWGDMENYPDFGVAAGDAYAGVSVSRLLGKIDKPSQLRIGENYSFEDLRNSPAVIVGAFNNRWTMQLTENLHFSFVEKNGHFVIEERTPHGQIWSHGANPNGELNDYAIVARLLNSNTGQFTVVVAGITGPGTEAAAEFVSNPEYLQKGLHDAPANWASGNLELVLQTRVTDAVAGPAHVVAAYYWSSQSGFTASSH